MDQYSSLVLSNCSASRVPTSNLHLKIRLSLLNWDIETWMHTESPFYSYPKVLILSGIAFTLFIAVTCRHTLWEQLGTLHTSRFILTWFACGSLLLVPVPTTSWSKTYAVARDSILIRMFPVSYESGCTVPNLGEQYTVSWLYLRFILLDNEIYRILVYVC